MSIFGKSFDDKVVKQLELREAILSGKTKDSILYGRNSSYLQYANNKNPFIRLTSAVDVVDEKLREYLGIGDQKGLALDNILEGGTQPRNTIKENFLDVYTAPQNIDGVSDFGLRPMPGITGISIKSYGENIQTLRIASITLDCYNI